MPVIIDIHSEWVSFSHQQYSGQIVHDTFHCVRDQMHDSLYENVLGPNFSMTLLVL